LTFGAVGCPFMGHDHLRLSYDDSEEGRCLSFHGTREGASAEYGRAQKKFPKRVNNCDILGIDVQPTQKGILRFLAQYCSADDNG
jgi:hypothetical protein